MLMPDARLEIARRDAVGNAMDVVARVLRVLEQWLGPWLDLLLRLRLAQIFFVSAVVKLANWDNALYLSAHEYPVAWMDPVTAAYVGIVIEFGGAILLAFGFATRAAAISMAALALVVQFNYLALDGNLLQAALFGWLVVRGAGALSLDHMLSRGLADSALPLAAPIISTLRGATLWLSPIYLLLLRAWAAFAIIATALHVAGAQFAPWLPVASAPPLAFGLAIPLATLLFLGLGGRVAAVGLMLAVVFVPATGAGFGERALWLFLLALVAVEGAGMLSVDELVAHALRARFPQLAGRPAFELDGAPRAVIVGAGFGGLACAAALAKARVAVTLIDRHNYHLFQPLLYQVATASLSPGDIAAPVRGLFREHFNVRVLLGEVEGVDPQAQTVRLAGRYVPYDYLVLATGAAHSYFGHDEWASFAPGLKRVEDATDVRRRLLTAFEQAEATDDNGERQSLLTFVIVGGGPTGVELAGAIAELARWGMEKDFRRFDPAQTRIVLIQAGPRVLPTFPEDLSETSRRSLGRLGIDVMLNSRVEGIDESGVTVNGKRIAARTVLWAAGVVASPAASWLGATADNAGRIKVGLDLSVPGIANAFAVGDTAASNAWNGNPVPGLAPAAKQAGAYVASVIRARVEGRPDPAPFVYRHLGSLATIGRKAAVVDFGWIKLRGALAWWFWGAIHVGFLVDVRSRLSVMFDWFWAYLTYRSGTRLITGTVPAALVQHER
jgi:NADH dehydrogenase/putative oxidoreductase